MIKICVEFSLTSFSTLKCDCAEKTREMFNLLSLINNSVTTGLTFLLLNISAIISSKTINILRSLPRLYYSIFLEASCVSFEYSIKDLKIGIFLQKNLLHINIFY